MPLINMLGGATIRGFGGVGGGGAAAAPPGQAAFLTAGTYLWAAPVGVSSVSVVAVGAGCTSSFDSGNPGASGGGGLGYKNNYPVSGGSNYTVKVGPGGSNRGQPITDRDSYFVDTSTVKGGGAHSGTQGRQGGSFTGDGGGPGGLGGNHSPNVWGAAAGAGGYSGAGGGAGQAAPPGGGGGGGAGNLSGGGGVGVFGEGSPGNAGEGGSGGADPSGTAGGIYGGGGAVSGGGGRGAVRILWPGGDRQFPTTRTVDE